MTRGADASATGRAREQAGRVAGPSRGKAGRARAREGERGRAAGPDCWAKIVFSFVYFVIN
jgi:hypothetical protein